MKQFDQMKQMMKMMKQPMVVQGCPECAVSKIF
jgi:hypothetical protein